MKQADINALTNQIPATISTPKELYDWFIERGVSATELRMDEDAVYIHCDDPPPVSEKMEHVVVVPETLMAGISGVLERHFPGQYRNQAEQLLNVWITIAKKDCKPGQFRTALEWASKYLLNATDVLFVDSTKGDKNVN